MSLKCLKPTRKVKIISERKGGAEHLGGQQAESQKRGKENKTARVITLGGEKERRMQITALVGKGSGSEARRDKKKRISEHLFSKDGEWE